jgi:hypothetical protein
MARACGDRPRGLRKSAYRSGHRTLGRDLGRVRVVPRADPNCGAAKQRSYSITSAAIARSGQILKCSVRAYLAQSTVIPARPKQRQIYGSPSL